MAGAPTTPARGRPGAHAPAGAQEAGAARAASLGPVSLATGSRGRGRAARAAAAAISAASCSSRPRRHGNHVTHRGRFPARLACVTLSARAPQSLTYRAPAFPRVLLLLLLRPHPGCSGAPSFPPLPALLPVPTTRGKEGGREIDGGRLLKNIVTVSVFITLTRERYLLLLFAERAAPERERPLGGSPFGRSPGSREGERKAGLRKDQAGAARGRRQTLVSWSSQPARPTPFGGARLRGETLQNSC